MAVGVIQKPGSKFGPCLGECKHLDCASNRDWAAALCRVCGKAIEYQVEFFIEPGGKFVHAVCVEDEVEAMQGLTSEQIARQDHVDNAIQQMLCEIAGKEVAWDIGAISAVRDASQQFVCAQSGMSEMEFYPYLVEANDGTMKLYRLSGTCLFDHKTKTEFVFLVKEKSEDAVYLHTDAALYLAAQFVDDVARWEGTVRVEFLREMNEQDKKMPIARVDILIEDVRIN